MVPRSAPKATLGASRLEVAKKGAKSFHKFEIIGATWAILAVFGHLLKILGGRHKRTQKFNTAFFGVLKRRKNGRKSLFDGLENRIDF